MYSTGRASLQTQQGEEERGEKTSVKKPVLPAPDRHRLSRAAAVTLAKTKCFGAGGIKKGPSFPIPTSILSRD